METAAHLSVRATRIEQMFPRMCSFDGRNNPWLAKGYCSAHYRQAWKGQPLRPLRPFYGKVRPYGPIGPCRFNDLPQVQSGEWELCPCDSLHRRLVRGPCGSVVREASTEAYTPRENRLRLPRLLESA